MSITVDNPLLFRLAGKHPAAVWDNQFGVVQTHPKVPVEAFFALMRLFGAGVITGTEANARLGQVSRYRLSTSNGADGYEPALLDSAELQQAGDIAGLIVTGNTTANKADRADAALRLRDYINVLEFGALPEVGGVAVTWTAPAGYRYEDATFVNGFAPASLTGTTVNGAAGGLLGIPRRQATYADPAIP